MKKLLLFVLFVFSVNFISAQTQKEIRKTMCNIVSNSIIEINDGVIVKNIEDDESYTVVVSLPTFYDFELFSTHVKMIIDKYNDLIVLKPWTLTDGFYQKSWRISDKKMLLIITYLEKTETRKIPILSISVN